MARIIETHEEYLARKIREADKRREDVLRAAEDFNKRTKRGIEAERIEERLIVVEDGVKHSFDAGDYMADPMAWLSFYYPKWIK